MKRIIVSLMLTIAVATGASAQSWKDLLGKVATEVAGEVSSKSETGNTVVNVLGSLLGNSLTLSAEAIEGTWSYECVACIPESENALSDIGGTVVTSQLESKMDGMLAKVGVKPGNCSFVFNKDGACAILVGNYTIDGTYELIPEEKVMNFSFMYGKLNLKANVAYEIQNLNIVFKADKLLNFIKSVTSTLSSNATGEQVQQLSSISQTAATLGTLLNAYDGMMLGAKMTKSSDNVAETVASSATTSSTTSSTSTATSTENSSNSTVNSIVTGLGKLFK
jgi:hypothetical protein